jgi:hypothetical protein
MSKLDQQLQLPYTTLGQIFPASPSNNFVKFRLISDRIKILIELTHASAPVALNYLSGV